MATGATLLFHILLVLGFGGQPVVWLESGGLMGTAATVFVGVLIGQRSLFRRRLSHERRVLLETQDVTIYALAHQAELRDQSTGEHIGSFVRDGARVFRHATTFPGTELARAKYPGRNASKKSAFARVPLHSRNYIYVYRYDTPESGRIVLRMGKFIPGRTGRDRGSDQTWSLAKTALESPGPVQ